MTRSDAYMALTTPELKLKRFEESLQLVKYVVGRLAVDLPQSIDRDDLGAWGAIGLWRAIQTYDASKGVAFSTHGYIHIRGAILDELRRMDFLPRSRRDRVRAIAEARQVLEQRLGRRASPEELAEESHLTMEELDEALLHEHSAHVLSMDETSSDDSGIRAIVAASREDDPSCVAEKSELREQLARAIEKLPKSERQVVTLYYAESLLLKEIGDLLGFSESRASQIHARALERLRGLLEPEGAEAEEARA
jgi:RNA polymerase sigma factor for flagellar operon FliA